MEMVAFSSGSDLLILALGSDKLHIFAPVLGIYGWGMVNVGE